MVAGRSLLAPGAPHVGGDGWSRCLVREARHGTRLTIGTRAKGNGDDAQGGSGMVETTADVRRDIELTRERMSSTLAELEQKLNLTQVVKDHPWPAVALAVGAGILLSRSGADLKAAAAT